LRRLENALLDQMRLDVVIHEQSLICRRDLFGKRSIFHCSHVAVRRPIGEHAIHCASVGTATGRLLQAAVAASLPVAPELRDGGCEAFPNIRLF
jgi:hypothetical protein